MSQTFTVQVDLTTQIWQDSGDEKFDFHLPGQLIIRNGTAYLSYTEQLPDQSDTEVRFKLKPQQVGLTRTNENTTHLSFKAQQDQETVYQTAAGPMVLNTYTTGLDLALDQAKGAGQLLLEYVLSSQGQVVGRYRVDLQFKP
ncbi:DUF1934 domain-containing protein [Convivina intestini]|uniref:DUF1934 domain-containing protein n=1 Tax=Convivina intestini TaxID=1505726 RepID=UPI002010A1CB|nr:DUF1934 domain-containing protein [Convivina intestini]CAH1850846.1 hypothetical protein R078131_00174 [Convivina intestini]